MPDTAGHSKLCENVWVIDTLGIVNSKSHPHYPLPPSHLRGWPEGWWKARVQQSPPVWSRLAIQHPAPPGSSWGPSRTWLAALKTTDSRVVYREITEQAISSQVTGRGYMITRFRAKDVNSMPSDAAVNHGTISLLSAHGSHYQTDCCKTLYSRFSTSDRLL